MNNELILKMMEHDAGYPSLIQHFIKVYEFSKIIGEKENISKQKQHILETAAIVHDIGILPAMAKYGNSAGKYQEELGPDEVIAMLNPLGYEKEVIERVCFLVGHHHTYTNIDDIDYQILVEADFLVNLYENKSAKEKVLEVKKNIFKTKTGLEILEIMFLKNNYN